MPLLSIGGSMSMDCQKSMYQLWLSCLTASWLILWTSNVFAAYPGPEPLPVVAGGTGAATLTQYGVLIGAGTGAIQTAAPGAAGIGLVRAGAAANPIFGTTTVPGGGTGLVTVTAHYTLVGNGTTALTMVAPSATVGVPYVSGGASADPSFTTALVAGGGTGLTTITAHAVMIGEGTSNVAVVGPTADSVLVYAAVTSDPVLTGSAATADSVLAWGSAPSQPAPLGINNCASALTYSTSTHTFGCNGSVGGVTPTYLYYTTAGASYTLSSTNYETVSFNQTTTQATTINLPATPAANTRKCIKDSGNGFAAHTPTIKTTDSSTIDTASGATGYLMAAVNWQQLCFGFVSGHGANGDWVVE